MNRNQPRAQINYVLPGEPLVYDQTHLGKGNQVLVERIDNRVLPLINGRELPSDELQLQKAGLELIKHDLQIPNLADDELIKSALYDQVVQVVSSHMGVQHAYIFDHTLRSEEALGDTNTRRAPVKTVHNDFTPISASRTVDNVLQSIDRQDSDYLKGRAFQFVNVWVPFKNSVKESPLAFLIPTTFSGKSQHKLELIYPDRVGEIYGYSYEEGHQWLYFDEMTTDELVIFKTYDSNPNAAFTSVPHTAVDLVGSNDASIPTRHSIEFRLAVFFDDEVLNAA